MTGVNANPSPKSGIASETINGVLKLSPVRETLSAAGPARRAPAPVIDHRHPLS
jgi:hypothetical protein